MFFLPLMNSLIDLREESLHRWIEISFFISIVSLRFILSNFNMSQESSQNFVIISMLTKKMDQSGSTLACRFLFLYYGQWALFNYFIRDLTIWWDVTRHETYAHNMRWLRMCEEYSSSCLLLIVLSFDLWKIGFHSTKISTMRLASTSPINHSKDLLDHDTYACSIIQFRGNLVQHRQHRLILIHSL